MDNDILILTNQKAPNLTNLDKIIGGGGWFAESCVASSYIPSSLSIAFSQSSDADSVVPYDLFHANPTTWSAKYAGKSIDITSAHNILLYKDFEPTSLFDGFEVKHM